MNDPLDRSRAMTRKGSHSSGLRTDLVQAMDAWRFNQDRRGYYDFLAALLRGTQGKRTLKQVFVSDATRHGMTSVRGRLASRWLRLFQAAGGDLYATWFGVMPIGELAVLRSAQGRGNDALVETLEELSRVLGVLEAARAILRASLITAVLAVLVLSIALLAVPLFTVPRLRDSFMMIPPEYYGDATRTLFGFAAVVGASWPLALAVTVGLLVVIPRSFGSYTGRLRRLLDGIGPWRIYRQVHALRFLALLAVALGRDEHGPTRLRMALGLQLVDGTPWMTAHVKTMIANVDTGRRAAAAFDSGLLDRSQLWFLDDMITARGLVEGLRLTSAWVERHVLGTVARQAAVARWIMLLVAVLGVMSLALWHYAVIDDMRRALALFHASQ